MRPRLARAGGLALAVLVALTACTSGSDGSRPPVAASLDPTATAAATGTPGATAVPSPASPDASPGENDGSVTLYVVRRGDTLSAIARAYETTVAQLQAWNVDRYPSLASDPGALEPGWELVVSGDPDATPLPQPPTPAPTQAPAIGCMAGNRVVAGGQQTFATIPGAGRAVALTFDMGGRMEPAVDIMAFLVANEVCATIFATGVMSETPQGQEVMAIIEAHPELFEIANHTMYHCDLVRGGGGSPSIGPCAGGSPSAERVRQELTDAEAILRAGTGQDPRPYWRPPYGSVNAAVLDAAASVGYTKTFLWDIDTVDWKPIADGGPSAEQIASNVISNSVSGSNVLFHLGGYETLEALHLIVPGLRERGFTLTSLSDLLD